MSGGNKRKKKKENKEERRKMVMAFVCLFLVFLLFAGFLIKIGVDKALYNRFEDRGLPRINIKLNGVSLDEIKNGSKETKYKDNELVLYNDGRVKKYDNVEVKGRGNMTWEQLKKPYQIKFSSKTDLLGLGRAKKWALLANYYDHSALRNDIVFTLAEMLDVNYNHRGKFVEMYFNDKYEGLYYLVQRIELSKGSVDLRSSDGILFEIDALHKYDEECYDSALKDCLVFKDAIRKDPNEQEFLIDKFMEDYRNAEMAAKEGEYDKVANILDTNSFAKYYLVNEFTVNPDAYMSSFFLYRDDSGKICAGPVWDFDYALGNREWRWQDDDSFFSPYEDEKNMNTKIMKYLLKMPSFQNEVRRVFQEKLAGRGEELVQTIQDRRDEINRAILVNNKKWNIENFKEDADSLLKWVKARYGYFEQKYESEREDINDQKRFQSL